MCRLRQVALHPDLTADLSCHHWTARAPELPDWAHQDHPGVMPADSEQLRLAGVVGDPEAPFGAEGAHPGDALPHASARAVQPGLPISLLLRSK